MKRPSDLFFVLLFFASIWYFTTDIVPQLRGQAPHGIQSEESPRGVIDGVNDTFALNFQPAPWGSIHVFRNGLRQARNLDYTLGGPNHMQVIFCPLVCIPQPGDILLADYTY